MMKYALTTTLLTVAQVSFSTSAWAAGPKLKLYDLESHLIDGEVRKPTAIFANARAKVRFDRLLKLERRFKKRLLLTAKARVFK